MTVFFLLYLLVYVLFGIGWIMNIVTLWNSGPVATWAAEEVLRCVGIFVAPLGALLGYF